LVAQTTTPGAGTAGGGTTINVFCLDFGKKFPDGQSIKAQGLADVVADRLRELAENESCRCRLTVEARHHPLAESDLVLGNAYSGKAHLQPSLVVRVGADDGVQRPEVSRVDHLVGLVDEEKAPVLPNTTLIEANLLD